MKWTAWSRSSAPAGALEQKAVVMKSAGVAVWGGGSARGDELRAPCHRGRVRATTGVKARVRRGHRLFLGFRFHFIKPELSRAHDITADRLVFKESNMFTPSPPPPNTPTSDSENMGRRCLRRRDRYPTNESLCR